MKSIDLNPYREIKDGKELGYLLLLKSLISIDASEPGILSAYEFSPDGKVFTGKLNRPLTWPDGTEIVSSEIATSVARQLYFRPLGERVTVLGTSKNSSFENLKKPGVPGIKIIDKDTFQLTFESQIQNLTGALREALTTNSRHNRIWPFKDTNQSKSLVLFKFPEVQAPRTTLKVNDSLVALEARSECSAADFALSADSMDPKRFEMRSSPNQSAATLQVSTVSLKLSERKALAAWVRQAFVSYGTEFHFTPAPGFFLEGENGHGNKKWPVAGSNKLNIKRPISIAYESPDYGKVLKRFIESTGAAVKLVPLPNENEKLDAQLLASSMSQGRQIILQDILNWAHVSKLMEGAPRTRKALESIAKRSSSTVPVDRETLQTFEATALAEISLVPIARRAPIAYSRAGIPICLDWTSQGELTFKNHGSCSKVSF